MAPPRSLRTRAQIINERLGATFPGTASELCALRHDNPFQLLVATILSAQCTDERVNAVMPEMIRCFPTPKRLAAADPEEVERVIRSTGFYHAKAKSLLGMATALVERFGGEVPSALEDLVTLPGVGRKTGNVIRSVAFDLPGLPVDTHVGRLSRRLGLTTEEDPVKVEHELCRLLPKEHWGDFSLRLILHGRATCVARKPRCEQCEIEDCCPSSPVNRARTRPASGSYAMEAAPSKRPPSKVPVAQRVAATSTVKKSTVKKSTVKKSTAKKGIAKKGIAKKSTAKKGTVEKSAVQQ